MQQIFHGSKANTFSISGQILFSIKRPILFSIKANTFLYKNQYFLYKRDVTGKLSANGPTREKLETLKFVLHRAANGHMEICQYSVQTWWTGIEDDYIKNFKFDINTTPKLLTGPTVGHGYLLTKLMCPHPMKWTGFIVLPLYPKTSVRCCKEFCIHGDSE